MSERASNLGMNERVSECVSNMVTERLIEWTTCAVS